LSFVANYFNYGNGFFEPQVFNLTSVDGKAACEFPILYYITAQLYTIFGEQEFILRLITITIVSLGFFSLFKLLILILDDILYALIFSFLFLSSTVLLYYTNNFLPDASALGFTLLAWYYFYLFKKRNKKYLFISFLFFTLGSLLKATYFINPIAAVSTIIVLDLLAKNKLIDIFKSNFRLLLIFFISTALLLSWNLFAIHYNAINKDFYFLVSTRPLWDIDRQSIMEVWDYISNYWYSKYYYQSTIHFFVIAFILGIVFIKKANKTFLVPGIIMLIGSIFYILLFYAQFKDHDYYFITLIPTIIILVVNAFITIRNKFPKLLNNYIAKILLLGLAVLSINYASSKLEERYSITNNEFAEIGVVLSDTRNSLDSLGISKHAKVIVFTDKTPNGGLYFLNRKGWNVSDTTAAGINKISDYKNLGAEFLVNTTRINFSYAKLYENSKLSIYKID
jgi:4-amino-4-deoxy-L-arabinose transferase-like glycosyltransferase